MKTLQQYLMAGLVLAVLVFSACGDDFLNLNPNEALPTEGAIRTIDDLEAAVIGIYSQIQNASYYGRYFLLLPDVMADDVKQNASANRAAEFAEYSAASFDFIPTDMWEEIYEVINRTNTVINSGLEVPDVLQAERDDLLGEAYAARALAHFDLVRMYGQHYGFTSDNSHLGVPIVLEFDQFREPVRNTVAEVYTQVEADFEQAIRLMDNTGSSKRFSKAAAQALLARVKLYKGEWAAAESLATEVINSGFASLTPTDALVSTWLDGGVPDAIFEVDYNVVDNNGSDALGGMYIETGYGDYLPSTDYLKLVPDGDVRGELFAIDSVSLGGVFGNLRVNKYASQQGEDNIPVIRLAEVYLIRAEARARQGDFEGAREDLNLVRQRGLPTAEEVTASGDELIEEILLEKRIELAYEGHRLFELTRLMMGVVRTDCTSSICEIMYPNNRFILPIPQAELDANPNITQNPGF